MQINFDFSEYEDVRFDDVRAFIVEREDSEIFFTFTEDEVMLGFWEDMILTYPKGNLVEIVENEMTDKEKWFQNEDILCWCKRNNYVLKRVYFTHENFEINIKTY